MSQSVRERENIIEVDQKNERENHYLIYFNYKIQILCT
jgi:hypothetical protein